MSYTKARGRGTLTDCRDCADPILFVQLDTGNLIPVNPGTNPAGNVATRSIGGKLHGYVISAEKPYRPDHHRHRAHFATCRSKPKDTPDPTVEPPELDTPLF